MASGSVIGNAFLTVTPKLDGDPTELGNKFGTEMSSGLKGAVGIGAVAVGNILANMVTSVAASLGDQISKTFWNYADYEQLVGGVDTLFKDASASVQANAQMAFMTAGLSANEYMENVTGFSAALINSLDGDTKAAAAVADMAMRDMSDNANKMGSDINEITRAYQSFARGQYGLLDNLKIGYGGTRSEMLRLLKDAEAISGVHYDIENYADVVEAIHVIQTEMDITGTTMLEGTQTISGSLGMLSAAWENFLTAIGDGGETMDLTTVTQNLVTSLIAAAKNVIPALGRIAMTVVSALPSAFADSMAVVIPQIQEAITAEFGEQGGSMFAGFVDAASGIGDKLAGIFTQLQSIVAQAMDVIQPSIVPTLTLIGSVVDTVANVIVSAVSNVVSFVNQYVMPTVSAIAATVAPVISGIASDIEGTMPAIEETMMGVFQEIYNFVADVWPGISEIISTVSAVISSVVSEVWPRIQGIISGVMGAVKTVVSSVWNVITGIIRTAVGAIKTVIGGISGVVSVVTNAFNAVKAAIVAPIQTAANVVKGAINTIKSIINGAKLSLPHFKLPHFVIDGGEIPWGIGGAGRKPTIDVRWYASGGIVDAPTLIGAGERGPELIWPSYDPYIGKYADAIASRMDGAGSIVVNLNYDAGADANQMARDLARSIKRYQIAKGVA